MLKNCNCVKNNFLYLKKKIKIFNTFRFYTLCVDEDVNYIAKTKANPKLKMEKSPYFLTPTTYVHSEIHKHRVVISSHHLYILPIQKLKVCFLPTVYVFYR